MTETIALPDRTLTLTQVLTVVDQWLKSDDIWVTDKDGVKVEGGLIQCERLTLTLRLLAAIDKEQEEE